MAEGEVIVTKFEADLSGLEKGVDDYAKTLAKAEGADDGLEKSQKDLGASTGNLAAKFEATAKSSKINADAVRRSREEAAKLIAANTTLTATQKAAAAAAGGITKEYNALAVASGKAARAVTSVTVASKASGGTFAALRTNITGTIGSYLGIGAAIALVISAYRKLGEMAGVIEKTDARARAIAGDTLPLLTKAAEANANAIGLTRREYIALAVDQQLRLKNLGLEGDFTAELATRTVDLSEKLSDFSGGQITAEAASQLLNDALTGQTRGLKALGINIKANKDDLATLSKEFQVTRGVTKEQGDALANLELVFRATQSSLDEFGKSELSLDAATDLANARLKEQEEALATRLGPAINFVRNALADFLGLLAGNADTQKLDDVEDQILDLLGARERFSQGADQFASNLTLGFIQPSSVKEAQDAIDTIRVAINKAGDDLGQFERLRQSLVAKRDKAIEAGDDRGQAVLLIQLEELAKAQKLVADETLKRGAAERDADAITAKAAQTVAEKRAGLVASLQTEKDAKELLAATDTVGLAAANKSISTIEEQIKALDGLTDAQKKSGEEAKRNAATVIEANKQIDDILKGVAREREDATLTDAQKEIAAVERKYADIAAETKKGFAKIAAATPASGQAEVAQRADDAQVKIKEAESAELIAIGQRTLVKLQADQDAADAFLAGRKREANEAALAALIEQQAREEEVVTAQGGNLQALYERQAQERLDLIKSSEEAQLQALVEDFEKEFAILDAQGVDTLALQEQLGREIAAMKDKFRKENLDKEEKDADKVLEVKRTAYKQELADASSLFSTLQEFSDMSFDRRIRSVEEKEADLQDQLAKATTEGEKSRIQGQIDATQKQKEALEKQKQQSQGFAIAASLINTYLAASQVLADPTNFTPIGKIVAVAAIIAAGLANVAKIRQFDVGGHTSKRASNSEPVGVVHANEWVAPAWQVKDPRYASTIKWLEEARKRKRSASGQGFIGGGAVNSQSACLAAGGQWVNGACVMAAIPPPRGSVFRRVSERNAQAECAAAGGVFINGACVLAENAPRFFIGGYTGPSPISSGVGVSDRSPAIHTGRAVTFGDLGSATTGPMPIIEALNYRDDAKLDRYVQSDIGQRMVHSVMLAKFYDKNIVETGERTNKALREQTAILAGMAKNFRPRNSRYY